MTEEKRRTILCVDDEVDITDSLRNTFIDKYNVKTARNGKEGLKIFNESDIDLVVSDQRMPEMTGVELFTEINKKKPLCKKILLTGYADINAAKDAINKASVNRYFDKPWDEEELLECTEVLMEELRADEFFKNDLGVCIVGVGETIEYVNKYGLEKLKCNNLADIKGKVLKDIFSISDTVREEMIKNYNEEVRIPSKVDIQLCDGLSTCVQALVSFTPDGDSVGLSGIIFFD